MTTVQKFTHREARALIREGFNRIFGREPKRDEAVCCQAVGLLETGYGAGWKLPEAVGSNNWGAITAPKSWAGETFEHRDSYPNADGTSTWYTTKFKKYATPADGATDLVRTVYKINAREELVLKRAQSGSVLGVSEGLYDSRYYTGFGPDRATRIAGHHKKMVSCVLSIAKAIGEEVPKELAALATWVKVVEAAPIAVTESEAEHGSTWAELRAQVVSQQFDVGEIVSSEKHLEMRSEDD